MELLFLVERLPDGGGGLTGAFGSRHFVRGKLPEGYAGAKVS
jgi:hypothetical protein